MKIKIKEIRFAIVLLITLCLIACETPKSADFTLKFNAADKKFLANEQVEAKIGGKHIDGISNVKFFLDDSLVGETKSASISFKLPDLKLGYQSVRIEVLLNGRAEPIKLEDRIEVVTDLTPKILTYEIVNVYPHEVSSFTEGFEFFRDTLLEGTGLRGQSKLLKTDFKTGKILKSLALEQPYFGEGITVINNQIFQLTWEEKIGFIYDADTWKLIKTFTYDKPIEGWGMTNDGTHIYHSDGTEKIWKMDPKTQKELGFINVYLGSEKIKQVNELEWIDGKIYGNVWQKDAIAVVNPTSGVVEAILDLSALRSKVAGKPEVLNGIAYRPRTKTIFVTGKNWDKVFEIKLK